MMRINSAFLEINWLLILKGIIIWTMIVSSLLLIDNPLTRLTVPGRFQFTEPEPVRRIPGRREGAGSY